MMEDGGGRRGTAQMMSHDAILIGSRCIISNSASTGGPSARTIQWAVDIRSDFELERGEEGIGYHRSSGRADKQNKLSSLSSS